MSEEQAHEVIEQDKMERSEPTAATQEAPAPKEETKEAEAPAPKEEETKEVEAAVPAPAEEAKEVEESKD
jgi:hypothetical protein